MATRLDDNSVLLPTPFPPPDLLLFSSCFSDCFRISTHTSEYLNDDSISSIRHCHWFSSFLGFFLFVCWFWIHPVVMIWIWDPWFSDFKLVFYFRVVTGQMMTFCIVQMMISLGRDYFASLVFRSYLMSFAPLIGDPPFCLAFLIWCDHALSKFRF